MKRRLIELTFLIVSLSIFIQFGFQKEVPPQEQAVKKVVNHRKPAAPVPPPPKRVKKREPAPKQKITPQVPPKREPDPMPSEFHSQKRELPELSIRGLSLGMTEAQTVERLGTGVVTNRCKDYWRGSPGRSARIGATWHRYGPYGGSYDLEGLCGAVHGDGLERYGVSILAVGDSGEDVERLLGAPSRADLSSYARWNHATIWSYNYQQATLTVEFLDGKVSSFSLQADNFSDSGC